MLGHILGNKLLHLKQWLNAQVIVQYGFFNVLSNGIGLR